MKTKYFIFSIIFFSAILFAGYIVAQSGDLENISYPIEELGSCKNKADCKAYCDNPDNSDSCLNFARKNNLMSEQEVKVAEKFIKGEINGPGGCSDKESCEEYCNDINRIDECVSFAEKNNLMPAEELEEAKKIQSAMARGVKPPPCKNKKSCDAYCEDSEHMEECITFATEAGFMQGKELEEAQKMLQAVKRGVKPPPCKGKEACDEYCSNPDNMELCMNFAIEAGFMSEQEKADSQKMLQAIKKGVKPPPCKGKEECDAYCGQEEHFEECSNFAVAAGFMSEKDAEMGRKTGGKGPGGCKGKEECESFCNNPDNQETCFNFAKENGMISEDELQKMGPRNFENPREGENFRPGPGQENPGGQMMPQQAGPGGCKGPEECQKFCESDPEKCQNFGRPPENENRPMPKEGIRQDFEAQPPVIQNPQGPPPENFIPPPPPGEGQFQQPPENNFQPPPENFSPPPNDSQPPPPPPPPAEDSVSPVSQFINTDSLIGSLIDAAFKTFLNLF